MPGLSILSIQDNITNYLRTVMQEEVHEDAILDDANLIKKNGVLYPYIVLRYGPLRRKTQAFSVAGARYDDYYSTVDVATVAPTGRIARQVMDIAVGRYLVGYKPEGGQEVTVEGGGSAEFVVTNSENKPSAYVSTIRMVFGVNQTGIGERP